MKTLDQEMAKKVYERIEKYAQKYTLESPERKKYGAMAHKLPILVRTAGLAEALAFVDSRNKEPFTVLLDDLAQVVDSLGRDEFTQKSRTVEIQEYMYLTSKTMLALKWFKRFAQSVLKVQSTDDGE